MRSGSRPPPMNRRRAVSGFNKWLRVLGIRALSAPNSARIFPEIAAAQS